MKDTTNRKQQIMSHATGPEGLPEHIEYTPEEHTVWRLVSAALEPAWSTYVVPELQVAKDRLGLSIEQIPQLNEVTDRLRAISGFSFHSFAGLASREVFFGSLANRKFVSTQFIRDSSTPFYTDEPDIVHELIGHATLLACPELAELHQLAGTALMRVGTERAKQFISDVWWFSGEFGVIESGARIKAFGAGILSSVAEIEHLRSTVVKPLDIVDMGTLPYEIDHMQSVVFAGKSIGHTLDQVGGFFDMATDDMIAEMLGGHHE